MNKTETKTIIRSLLSSSNSTFGIYTLNKEFKNETGIDIPLFGYTTLSDFLESIPDTVKLTGVYPVQKVSLVGNKTSGHIVSLVKRQRRDKKTKSGGQFWKNNSSRCRNSFEDRKSDAKENEMPPLVLAKIPLQGDADKFKNKKIHQIKEKKSNPSQNLESNFDKKAPERKPRFKNKKFTKKNEKKSSSCNQEPRSSPVQKNPTMGSVQVPPCGIVTDASQCFAERSEEIPAIDLKNHATVGYYVEVYPCEISHPGLFYLNLRKFKKPLSNFMDKLQKFYNEHEEIPNLIGTPKPGQVCAAFYSRNGNVPHWHRVQVEEVLNDFLVLVRFIDYGSTVKILVKNLKALHRDFSSFPMQAVLGSLANIKPSGGRSEWSKAAVKRFHELAFCRDLIAGVESMEGGLNVALSITEGEEIHVNDTLVDEGHAEFDFIVEDGDKSEVEVKNSGGKSAASDCELPSPVFFPSKNCNNSRLQKMFSRQE